MSIEFKDFMEAFAAFKGFTSNEKSPNNDTGVIGKKCIIRARDAGVHYGELVSYQGREVVLKNSRRLWRWYCEESISLSDVSLNGVKHKDSKIAPMVDSIIICDACEIIPCAEKAIKSIEGAPIAAQS